MRFAWSIVALPLFFACSTAPDEQVTEKLSEATQFAQLGNDAYDTGSYGQALEFFNLSLAYNGAIDNQAGIVQSYNSLGRVYLAQGFPDLAEQNLLRALELAEEMNDVRLIAITQNNRGEVWLSQGDYEKALPFFQAALSEAGDIPQSDLALIYHNLGSVYKRLNQLDLALESFDKALALNERAKNVEEAAANLYMIASIHSERGEYQTALAFAQSALANDKLVENSLGIAKDYLALGLISKKTNSLDEALEYFEKGLFVYRSIAILQPNIPLDREVKDILGHLIETAGELGQTEKVDTYSAILSGGKE
jgi:tetratricopeptide (TPR) repeat protein